MALTPLQLGLRSNQARDTAVGSAVLVNCYAESVGEDAKAPNPIYACDGWSAFSTLTSGGVTRGMFNVDDTRLWVLSGARLFRVTTAGVSTSAFTLNSTGYGYFARNRASTPNVALVTSDGYYLSMTGASVSQPTLDVTIDQTLFNSVCSLDGFFIFTKSNGEFYISGIDTTTVDPLDFAPALGASGSEKDKLTGLVRGVVRGRDLVLAGASGMTFWQNTGNADFPFQRVHIATFGTYAGPAMVPVVGVTDGTMTDTLIWPATGPDGGYIGVMMLMGYDAKKISTWEVDNAIRTATKANVRAYAYQSQGNTFYCITDATTFSYEFNCRTGFWHQRKGYGLNFARTVDACVFNGGTIFGDYTSGALYQQSTSVTPGASTTISLQHSRDNGSTFTTARTKTVGTSSARTTRTKFNRIGQSKQDGFQFKLTINAAYVEGGNDIAATIIPPAVHATPLPIVCHALYVDAIPGVSATANQKGAIALHADIEKVQA